MRQLVRLLFICTVSHTAQAQKPNFMPMVYVEGGTFNMGSNDDPPIHEVTLSSFYIGKYEVTVGQYRTYCAETRISLPEPPSWGWNDNDPIVNVNWQDAKDFANWLSKRTGRRYDLPTEAQWEYAARGGKRHQDKNYTSFTNLETSSWYNWNSAGRGHPVGQKMPNELGVYDMFGNVWEWCRDWYHIYYNQSPSVDPDNQTVSPGRNRVLRGGAWDCRFQLRPDFRYFEGQSLRSDRYGFRLVSQ